MAETQVFFFQVKFDDGSTCAVHVKAPDLVTAKDCVEARAHVLSAVRVNESEIPPDVRAKLTEPFDCPPSPEFPYVGIKPT